MKNHIFNVIIDDSDIDHLSHVNNASYIKWIQAAVTAHWQQHATLEMQSQYLWIALRHEIDYIQQSFRSDNLIVELKLKELKKVRVSYAIIIKRGSEVIAKAISKWCCIDSKTYRPKRIPLQIETKFDVPLDL